MKTNISLLPVPSVTSFEARVAELLEGEKALILITILESEGSAPRHAGTKALFTHRGLEGTIGGGLLEARVLSEAEYCLDHALSRRLFLSLDASLEDSDMICGGSADVLCEYLSSEQKALFARAASLVKGNVRAYWFVDDLGVQSTGAREVFPRRCLAVQADGGVQLDSESGPKDEWADGCSDGCAFSLNACEKMTARLQRQSPHDRYLEPLAALPVLLLCGGGHVSLEVARLASACDFLVDVVDDRADFVHPQRFPMARARYVLPDYAELVKRCAVGPMHYVAIMTRGHRFDLTVLEQVLAVRPFYVGMIGSRRKRDQLYAALSAKGVSQALLSSVCCPIGLPVRAETPQQIAVAVVSELLAAQRKVLNELRSPYQKM